MIASAVRRRARASRPSPSPPQGLEGRQPPRTGPPPRLPRTGETPRAAAEDGPAHEAAEDEETAAARRRTGTASVTEHGRSSWTVADPSLARRKVVSPTRARGLPLDDRQAEPRQARW